MYPTNTASSSHLLEASTLYLGIASMCFTMLLVDRLAADTVHHIVSYIVLSRIRSQLFTVFLVVLVEAAATLKFALAAFDGRMVERENLSPQQPPRTQHSRYVGEVTSLEYLTRVTVAANTGRMLARYNENNEGLQQLLELRNYTNNDVLLLHPEDEDVISVAAFVASWITVGLKAEQCFEKKIRVYGIVRAQTVGSLWKPTLVGS
ncbi:hypothetical protein Tco_0823139 [Tanacetum coccineum]|uniref:Uncharacterized protein n=1 Tax=Tanacetum coccineum TaxID=301880 RepID=A0ABQ5AH18_9ASTR